MADEPTPPPRFRLNREAVVKACAEIDPDPDYFKKLLAAARVREALMAEECPPEPKKGTK
jgi:hypothetical protein